MKTSDKVFMYEALGRAARLSKRLPDSSLLRREGDTLVLPRVHRTAVDVDLELKLDVEVATSLYGKWEKDEKVFLAEGMVLDTEIVTTQFGSEPIPRIAVVSSIDVGALGKRGEEKIRHEKEELEDELWAAGVAAMLRIVEDPLPEDWRMVTEVTKITSERVLPSKRFEGGLAPLALRGVLIDALPTKYTIAALLDEELYALRGEGEWLRFPSETVVAWL